MATTQIDTFSIRLDTPDFYPRRRRVPPNPSIDLPPLRTSQLRQMEVQQTAFDKAFPPLRTPGNHVLILNWEEIERQFLDLSPPWDQQNAAYLIRQARQMAAWETPEKTMRWLFVLSHASPGPDAIEPPCGTGDCIPMP